jgi:hypothetical protein
VYVPELLLSTVAGLHVPVMLFVDVFGNAGTTPPAQIVRLLPKVNEGGMFGATDTVNVNGIAQRPAAGVNVYEPDALLLTVAGLHVPVTPLSDVFGNVGTEPPAQIFKLLPKPKVGATFGFTVTLNVVGRAHKPAVGVNVYVPEILLSTLRGLHVPVMPFVDVVGKDGTDCPAQIVRLVPKLNVGATFGVTVTVNVAVVAQSPGVGVNM